MYHQQRFCQNLEIHSHPGEIGDNLLYSRPLAEFISPKFPGFQWPYMCMESNNVPHEYCILAPDSQSFNFKCTLSNYWYEIENRHQKIDKSFQLIWNTNH